MAMNYNAKADGQPGGSGLGASGGASGGTAAKSRKPDNTAFKQQRLPAWQPILTAGTVLPAFFVIGLIFIPIGIGIFVTSNNIREYEIDYTGIDPNSPCNKCLNVSWNGPPCHCVIDFTLDQPFEQSRVVLSAHTPAETARSRFQGIHMCLVKEGNVFMYYGLSNFYQNHRRYVKSRDDSQLNGNNISLHGCPFIDGTTSTNRIEFSSSYTSQICSGKYGDLPEKVWDMHKVRGRSLAEEKKSKPSKECEPYHTSENKPIAPCGAIANSMFNDTLTLSRFDHNTSKSIPIRLLNKGIAWWTDKNVKFRNPTGDTNNLTILFQGTSKPVNWHKPVYKLDSDADNNGFINEDFIVWMRTAALPTFRKLYRLIERQDSLQPTLPAGKYSLEIQYNYPVHSFDGRKRMILSTISWMGGKNPFLGIAYITVGSICFFLGVVLLIIHHKYGNRNNSADIPN